MPCCVPSTVTVPACEKVAGNVHYGQCVECTESNASACTGATPVCDPYRNTCTACVWNYDCPATAPVCTHPGHTCTKCATSDDCPPPATCDANGACVGGVKRN